MGDVRDFLNSIERPYRCSVSPQADAIYLEVHGPGDVDLGHKLFRHQKYDFSFPEDIHTMLGIIVRVTNELETKED